MPQIMINGCNVAYEEHGTGQNTIVFLHDLFFNGRSFTQQIIALRDRYRCITLDLRGHGQSVVSSAGYALDTLAHDVSQLIDINRYGSCHLIGAGFGGTVAVKAALDRPEQIASLTVIGSALGNSTSDDIRSLRTRRLHIKLFGLRFVARAILRRTFSQSYLTDADLTEQIAHWRNEMLMLDRRALPKVIGAYLARPSLTEALYAVRQPTLILGGQQDAVVTPDDFTHANNMISGSRLLRIPDAGHAVHIEKPNAVNPALLEFLKNA